MQGCEPLILAWFAKRIEALNPYATPKDDKTRLQEYLQGRQLPLPEYEVIDISGKSHDQTFTVKCTVAGLNSPIIGRGKSRRRAEQRTAKQALENLKNV